MSTGKRLAKRSIIGTRVCVKGEDGMYHSGVINAVKSWNGQSDSRYSVRFDPAPSAPAQKREYRDSELIGPGFKTMQGVRLLRGQRVFITYNGRETSGEVLQHCQLQDEVVISLHAPALEAGVLVEGSIEVRKRLEDVRLTECRKSARLQDQDTDYSRLADMAGDRRRLSSSIDVPTVNGSRKRRPSTSQDDQPKEDLMDECTAALVLMHLSCSPHSSPGWFPCEPLSPSSDACSFRSGTPSPPLSESAPTWLSTSDEGIDLIEEYDEYPRKKKANLSTAPVSLTAPSTDGNDNYHAISHPIPMQMLAKKLIFKCTWPGCYMKTTSEYAIEAHVRNFHIRPLRKKERERREREDGDEGMVICDHEEEFYYTEVEVGIKSPLPTLSHRDMARPAHEDPEYQKSLQLGNGLLAAGPISIPSTSRSMSSAAVSPTNSQKQMKLSVSAPASAKIPSSPSRRIRGDTKKCRKVYGMEHRDMWCTQCKWKKACTRFGD